MTPPRLADLRFFLLDMDGTVYLGPNPIPGAAQFIQLLRDSGRQFLFLTNNPTSDSARYAEKLRGMGIDAAPQDVLTAGAATADYLARHTPHRRVFVLGTPSFEDELRRAGIQPVGEDPEAVVLSFDTTLTYAKLKQACLLLRKGLPYIATNPDRVCPTEYGYIPDCGAMAALVAEATEGRTPLFIGKPAPEFAQMAMERLGADPARTTMVGDRLYTDMEMARRAAMASILVLSGETTQDVLDRAEWRPDFVFPSVRELGEALG
jgi:HAD superfamily hydrolase (TIGR01457 family)